MADASAASISRTGVRQMGHPPVPPAPGGCARWDTHPCRQRQVGVRQMGHPPVPPAPGGSRASSGSCGEWSRGMRPSRGCQPHAVGTWGNLSSALAKATSSNSRCNASGQTRTWLTRGCKRSRRCASSTSTPRLLSKQVLSRDDSTCAVCAAAGLHQTSLDSLTVALTTRGECVAVALWPVSRSPAQSHDEAAPVASPNRGPRQETVSSIRAVRP